MRYSQAFVGSQWARISLGVALIIKHSAATPVTQASAGIVVSAFPVASKAIPPKFGRNNLHKVCSMKTAILSAI